MSFRGRGIADPPVVRVEFRPLIMAVNFFGVQTSKPAPKHVVDPSLQPWVEK